MCCTTLGFRINAFPKQELWVASLGSRLISFLPELTCTMKGQTHKHERQTQSRVFSHRPPVHMAAETCARKLSFAFDAPFGIIFGFQNPCFSLNMYMGCDTLATRILAFPEEYIRLHHSGHQDPYFFPWEFIRVTPFWEPEF